MKKSHPCDLLILQRCMQIFAWNFTQLFSNKTNTLSPSFVEIHAKTTTWCCFNRDTSHFSPRIFNIIIIIPFVCIVYIVFATVPVHSWRLAQHIWHAAQSTGRGLTRQLFHALCMYTYTYYEHTLAACVVVGRPD